MKGLVKGLLAAQILCCLNSDRFGSVVDGICFGLGILLKGEAIGENRD